MAVATCQGAPIGILLVVDKAEPGCSMVEGLSIHKGRGPVGRCVAGLAIDAKDTLVD